MVARWLVAVLFIFAVGMAGGPASGASSQPLYQVFTEELPPVHYTLHGQRVGIATDIVRAIFAEAGLRCAISSYPWKRTYAKVLHTPASFVYTINRTPQRERLFHWIGPILPKRTYLYRLSSRDDIAVRGVDDLKRYRTAVILGYALTSRLMESGLRPGRELVVCPDKDNQMRVFLSGRADLVTGNEYTIGRALKTSGRQRDEVTPALLMSEQGYYLGANLQTPATVIDSLRRANDRVQASGLVDKIVQRYMVDGL